MKKVISVSIVSFIFIIVIILLKNYMDKPIKDYEFMHTQNINFDGKKLTVQITNNTNTHLTYGNAYRLEKLINNVWVEQTFREGADLFNAIALNINKDEQKDLEFNIKNSFNNIDKGSYRVSKEFSNNQDEVLVKYITFEVN